MEKNIKRVVDLINTSVPNGQVQYIKAASADRYVLNGKPTMSDAEIEFLVYMIGTKYKWTKIDHGGGECTIILQDK